RSSVASLSPSGPSSPQEEAAPAVSVGVPQTPAVAGAPSSRDEAFLLTVTPGGVTAASEAPEYSGASGSGFESRPGTVRERLVLTRAEVLAALAETSWPAEHHAWVA